MNAFLTNVVTKVSNNNKVRFLVKSQKRHAKWVVNTIQGK